MGDGSIEARLRAALARDNHEICQVLGKALGYAPHYPAVSDVDDGTVCVGDHVAASIAAEAARRIEELGAEVARLKAERDRLFAWAVDCEQIDNNDYNLNYFHPREGAIEAISRVMKGGDGPDGATLDALDDHDRRVTTWARTGR